MELYIIRHGQSSNNVLPDQRGRSHDAPLTDLGKRQADLLAEHLAAGMRRDPILTNIKTGRVEPVDGQGCGLTRLYCSPMQRALQTAQPISRALGLAPEVWVDIHEHGGVYLDHGGEKGVIGYPGKTRAEIRAEFPGYILPERITEGGWWTGGFEDAAACQLRAMEVAAQLRDWAEGDFQDERVAIITHGTFTDWLLKTLLRQPSDGHFYWHYNTGITRLDFGPDGFVVVRYLNRVDHLPPDMIS